MALTAAQTTAACTVALQKTDYAWYSHSGGNTIKAEGMDVAYYTSVSFSRQQAQLEAILANQKKIMAHQGIGGFNPGTPQV